MANESENTKELRSPKGSSKNRHRVGRGSGSGWGCTSGRGMNGQRSRSGYSRTSGFEGGQMPLVRRIPKYGFTNTRFKTEYDVINVSDLEGFSESEITLDILREKGFLSGKKGLIKLLGQGELTKAVNITVNAASKSAIEKVESKGGKVTVIETKKWIREKNKKNDKVEA